MVKPRENHLNVYVSRRLKHWHRRMYRLCSWVARTNWIVPGRGIVTARSSQVQYGKRFATTSVPRRSGSGPGRDRRYGDYYHRMPRLGPTGPTVD